MRDGLISFIYESQVVNKDVNVINLLIYHIDTSKFITKTENVYRENDNLVY